MARWSEKDAIRLRLVLRAAPPGVHDGAPTEFGPQDKAQVLHPGTTAADGSLEFVCSAQVRRRDGGAIDLGGPFVHGPAGGRFLYFGWRAAGADRWIRRYKVALQSIDADLVAAGGELIARVALGHAVAVVFEEGGWRPSSG